MGRPGLTRHRKFLRLAREIERHHPGLGVILARGGLEHLWDAAYESGEPFVGDAADIEGTVHWSGAAGAFCDALCSAGGEGHHGFIEPAEGGGYIIHDLFDHAPEYVQRRMEREAARHAKGLTISDLRRAAARARWAQAKATASDCRLHIGAGGPDAPVLQTADACTDVMQTDAKSVTPAPAPAPAPAPVKIGAGKAGATTRKTDLLFETVATACGLDRQKLTDSERGRLNKAVTQLRKVEATPEQVQAAAQRARREWGDGITVTATALAANWTALTGRAQTRNGDRPPLPNAEVKRLRELETEGQRQRRAIGDRGDAR